MTKLKRMSAAAVCAVAFLMIGLTSAFAQDAARSGQTQPSSRIIWGPAGQERPSGGSPVESQVQVDPVKRFERLEALVKRQGEEIEALKKENTGVKIRLAVVEPGLVDTGNRLDKANKEITQLKYDLLKANAAAAKAYEEYANHSHKLNMGFAESGHPGELNVVLSKFGTMDATKNELVPSKPRPWSELYK